VSPQNTFLHQSFNIGPHSFISASGQADFTFSNCWQLHLHLFTHQQQHSIKMDCFCYHCRLVFPSLAAREIHILQFSNLPPFPHPFHFRVPPYPITPEASHFILDPLQFASSSKMDIDMDSDVSPLDLNDRIANDGLNFIMDPSTPSTPSMEFFADFQNPFMDSHTPSPRMFPRPAQFLPTVPTVENWALHLLKTGCTKLGYGCLANCIPGEESEEYSQQSRFPLMPGLNSYPESISEVRPVRTRLPSSPIRKVVGSRISKRPKRLQNKSKCFICQRSFIDLESHIKIHEKEMRWHCQTCDEVFPRKWMLERHVGTCSR
jgi:hypothetical protein